MVQTFINSKNDKHIFGGQIHEKKMELQKAATSRQREQEGL